MLLLRPKQALKNPRKLFLLVVDQGLSEGGPHPPGGGGLARPGTGSQPADFFPGPGPPIERPKKISAQVPEEEKLEKLKGGKHPATEFCGFPGSYFDTRSINAGAECGFLAS